MDNQDQQPPQNAVNKSPSSPSDLSSEEKTWGMLAHFSGLVWLVGIPFGNILGPLLVWVLKRDEMNFVNRAGKEALNFQISMMIYGIIVAILCFVFIGMILAPILFLAYIILTVVAGVKAKEGSHYRYPFTIRFIS